MTSNQSVADKEMEGMYDVQPMDRISSAQPM